MSERFNYIAYDAVAMKQQIIFKQKFLDLEQFVDQLQPGRSHSMAMTKLEETYMWVGKAIRDDQIKRNGTTELMEERKDG